MAVLKVKKKKVIIKQNATRVYPTLEDLEITPSREEQNFKSTKYGYDNIKVNAIESNELEIKPGVENQEFNGMYHSVKVFGDEDLTPQNIRDGVEIFGVKGTGQILDLEINDCHALFDNGHRLEIMDKILKICKNVTTTYEMFNYGYNSKSAEMLDLTNYTYDLFHKNQSTRSMFNRCGYLKNLKLGNIEAPFLTEAYSMFNACQRLETLDMTLNAPNLQDAQSMFNGCYLLKEITGIEKFFTSNMKSIGQMFWSCRELEKIDLSKCDGSNLTNYANSVFQDCRKLKRIDISTFTSTKMSNTSQMFAYCSSLEAVIINQNRVFPMTNVNMFSGSTIESGTGYIYVPDTMVDEYKKSTNWSTYASQIKGLSELPPEEA